jgi:hypothetical protein
MKYYENFKNTIFDPFLDPLKILVFARFTLFPGGSYFAIFIQNVANSVDTPGKSV